MRKRWKTNYDFDWIVNKKKSPWQNLDFFLECLLLSLGSCSVEILGKKSKIILLENENENGREEETWYIVASFYSIPSLFFSLPLLPYLYLSLLWFHVSYLKEDWLFYISRRWSLSLSIYPYINLSKYLSINQPQFLFTAPPFYCFIIFQCLLISVRPLLLFTGYLRTRKTSHSPRSLLGLVLYELYGNSFESVLYGYPVLQSLPSE